MLKVLLQQKLLSVGAWITGASRKRKTQSKASAIGFFLIMLYAFGSVAFLYYNLLSVLFSNSFCLHKFLNLVIMADITIHTFTKFP